MLLHQPQSLDRLLPPILTSQQTLCLGFQKLLANSSSHNWDALVGSQVKLVESKALRLWGLCIRRKNMVMLIIWDN